MAQKPFEEARFVIATPHMEYLAPNYHYDTVAMYKSENTELFYTGFTYLDEARNEAAKRALETNADALMFIDSDMVLAPHDGMKRLWEHDKDIIAGLYFMRKKPFSPVCYYENPDKESNFEGIPTYRSIEMDYEKGGLLQVGCVGTGYTMIKTKVFQRWWEWEEQHEIHRCPGDHSVTECLCCRCTKIKECFDCGMIHAFQRAAVGSCPYYKCTTFRPFRLGYGYGEDMWLSHYARHRFGFEVWVDLDMIVGHKTEVAVIGKELRENQFGPKLGFLS